MALGFGRLAALVVLGVALTSCSPPPPPPPTIVNLSVKAAGDINPNVNGAPSPVQVRIYQLTSPVALNGAEFFALNDRETATLGDQLVRKEEMLVAPGETKTTTLNPEARVTQLGAFIAVRSIDGVTWRANVAVPPNQTTAITLHVSRAGLRFEAAP